jgi:hypothetical protein
MPRSATVTALSTGSAGRPARPVARRNRGYRESLWAIILTLAYAPIAAGAARQPPATARPPHAEPAVEGVRQLFGHKAVVAVGDLHGLAQEGDFYAALVRDPRFAAEVGNVVVEFGSAGTQQIIDRYVAGEEVRFDELRRVWSDLVGWFPGESQLLSYANFFASVRAANSLLPAERRIKIWLGEPQIDWSQTRSFRDVGRLLGNRDQQLFGLLDNLLKQGKKALLIVGWGHLLTPSGAPGQLTDKITEAYPQSLAIVTPFAGYREPACTTKLLSYAQRWPVPALATALPGIWLRSQRQSVACHAIVPEKMSDAILYLGPPQSFTQSPPEPSLYLDLDYFKEISRRSQCCTLKGQPLDWQQLLRDSSAAPHKFEFR